MIGRAALPIVVLALLAGGCPRREPLPDLSTFTPEVARLRLEKEAARRLRAAAVVKAKAPGWQGVFAAAELDVVVAAPDDVLVAVRSFFEQPMQVFGTDGETVTLFDGTGDAGPRWYRGPAGERALSVLLPIPISPQVAAPLLLGRADAAGARARELTIDERARTYRLELERDGRRSLVVARLDDDVLVTTTVFTGDGRKLLTCDYDDVRAIDGVPFAHRLVLRLFATEGPREIVLEARAVELNGPPFPPGAFLVEPPPGTAALPLPGAPREGETGTVSPTPELGAAPPSP